MRMIILFLSIALTACAEDVKKEAAPGPLVKDIPQGCTPTMVNGQVGFGSHEFPGGNIQTSIELDCGVREGMRCFYYHHTGATLLEDVRCTH